MADLKEKYHSALALQPPRNTANTDGGLDKRDVQDENLDGLVFNKMSSDYCNLDPLTGSYGTRHRYETYQ